jgi:hypothetical protein
MDEESIHINLSEKGSDHKDQGKVKQKEIKPETAPTPGSFSSQAKLLITALVLFFIALNVWGYYFYKKGIFGINADISKSTSSPSPVPVNNIEKSDSVYMIPGV